MSDNTTTDESVVTSGAEQAPPETTDQTTAVNETTDQPATQAEESQAPEGDTQSPPEEDKLASFAKGQGIENLDELNDRERSLLKMAYDNKSSADKNFQRASELEKATQQVADDSVADQEAAGTPYSETDRVVLGLVVKDRVRDFYDSNPEAREYDQAMAEILATKPHLVNDLDAVYALASRGSAADLKSQGGKEALESLASKQRASAPTGSAVNSAPSTANISRAEIDRRLADGDNAWYEKNRTQIIQMMKDGTLQ